MAGHLKLQGAMIFGLALYFPPGFRFLCALRSLLQWVLWCKLPENEFRQLIKILILPIHKKFLNESEMIERTIDLFLAYFWIEFPTKRKPRVKGPNTHPGGSHS